MASDTDRPAQREMARNLYILESYKLIFLRTREVIDSHDQLTNVMQEVGFSGAVDVCYDELSGIFWRQYFVPSSPWVMASIPLLPLTCIDVMTLLRFLSEVQTYTGNSREFEFVRKQPLEVGHGKPHGENIETCQKGIPNTGSGQQSCWIE